MEESSPSFSHDLDEGGHFFTMIAVAVLTITGAAAIIFRYMKDPVDQFEQNGKIHKVIKSSWAYYWIYRLVKFLSWNFVCITSAAVQNDSKIGIVLGTFLKICNSGVLGKKMKSYARETYKIEKEVTHELKKDAQEAQKIVNEIDKNLNGVMKAEGSIHTQIPYQITPTHVEVKHHDLTELTKNKTNPEK